MHQKQTKNEKNELVKCCGRTKLEVSWYVNIIVLWLPSGYRLRAIVKLKLIISTDLKQFSNIVI